MKHIQVEKVTLNIGTGEPGDKLEKAKKLLNKISGMKSVPTVTSKRIPTWKIRPGLAIGCKVTLRRKKALELLPKLLQGADNAISEKKFDNQGNFSFGVKEYLDIPGLKYDAEIGVIGLDVSVTLGRPGYRIKRRKVKKRKIPLKHRVSKAEAIEFMKKNFNVRIE